MKRSRLSYDEWNKVILDKRLKLKFVNNTSFKGCVGEIDILKVSEHQIWNFNGEDIVVCQKGYKWISILPSDEYFCIAAMMNSENHILLWYIDMLAEQGVDADDVPYFDDLYLDLVVYPDGSVVEDDRDELEEALEKQDITLEQFELANRTCEKLKKGLLADWDAFAEYTLNYQKLLLN